MTTTLDAPAPAVAAPATNGATFGAHDEPDTLTRMLSGARAFPGAAPTLDRAVYERNLPAITPSIFARKKDTLYATYRIRLQFRTQVMGGTPKDPNIIKTWLRSKTGVQPEEELQAMTADTLRDLGVDVPEHATWEQIVAASEQIADNKSVGFKRDRVRGVFLDGRTAKAMLKECTNILYAGQRWGTTKKGPKQFVAERVFVQEDRLYFHRVGEDGKLVPIPEADGSREGATNVLAADGTQLFVGHTTGPKGPQSNLTLYEFVTQPVIEFHVMVLRNEVSLDQWEGILMHAEENGLAALRSQGYGRFNVLEFERLPDRLKPEKAQPLDVSEPTEAELAREKAGGKPVTLEQRIAEEVAAES